MKKFLFLIGITSLTLSLSCGGNKVTNKVYEDSMRTADSLAQVETARQTEEAAQAAAEQARLDSIASENERKQDIFDQMMEIIEMEKKALMADGGDPRYMEYFTSDLDEDGIPELWITDNEIHNTAFTKIYALQADGKVRHIGNPGAYGTYHKGSNYLKYEYMHQGWWIIIKYTLKNGKLIEKTVDEGSFFDPDDPSSKDMPEIKEPKIRSINISNFKPLRESFYMD